MSNMANTASMNYVTLFLCPLALTITISSATRTRKATSQSVALCCRAKSQTYLTLVVRPMALNAFATLSKSRELQLAKNSFLNLCAKWDYLQYRPVAKQIIRKPSNSAALIGSSKSLMSVNRIQSGSAI